MACADAGMSRQRRIRRTTADGERRHMIYLQHSNWLFSQELP
jgi:hypothetical protein